MLKIMGTSSCQDCGAAEPVCGECAEKKIAELEAEMKRRHSATTEDLRKMVAMQGRINELEAELEQLKEDFAHQVEMTEEADNEVERLKEENERLSHFRIGHVEYCVSGPEPIDPVDGDTEQKGE